MGVLNESDRLLQQDKRAQSTEAPVPQQEPQQKPWQQSLKGILAAIMYVVAHVVGITSVQLLQRRIPDLELQVFRCCGIVITSLFWMLAKQTTVKLPWPDVPVMLLYGIVVTLDATAVYVGFALIPASAAQSADTTCSLLSGLLIYWFCGQERFSCKRALLAMVCLVGAILVLQPWDDTDRELTKETPMWSNHTEDCILQIQKLCSLKEHFPKVLLVKCRNHMQKMTNWNEMCESLVSTSAAVDFEHDLNLSCTVWESCLFNSSDTRNYQSPVASKWQKEKKTVLFQQPIPQKYVTLTGVILVGFSGVTLSLLGAMFKKFECLHEDIWRSLFWSFLSCLICSVILTFVVEVPVWPRDSFDVVQVLIHASTSAVIWISLVSSLQWISGSTFNIIISTLVVFFLISQYTILSSILPGQKNWMEVVGVFLVLIGSVLASALEMFETSENV